MAGISKSETMNRLSEKTGLTKKQVGQFLDELASLAYKEARNGFTIPGVGKLVVVDRKARMGRNPATGQPRPAASGVSRAGIASLVEKTDTAAARLAAEFPLEPDTRRSARHPYYGDLNCFGWLLMLPTHYKAHLEALDQGRPSAL